MDKVGTKTLAPLVAHLEDKVETKIPPVAHLMDKVGTKTPPLLGHRRGTQSRFELPSCFQLVF